MIKTQPTLTYKILSCSYVSNTTDIIVLLYDSTLRQANLSYVRNYVILYERLITTPPVFKLPYNIYSDLILILANAGINLYAVDTSFTILKTLSTAVSPVIHFHYYQKDYFLYCMDGSNYFLTNRTNNFSIIYQGSVPTIKKLLVYYPYYILINDGFTTLHQIDIQINQTIQIKAQV